MDAITLNSTAMGVGSASMASVVLVAWTFSKCFRYTLLKVAKSRPRPAHTEIVFAGLVDDSDLFSGKIQGTERPNNLLIDPMSARAATEDKQGELSRSPRRDGFPSERNPCALGLPRIVVRSALLLRVEYGGQHAAAGGRADNQAAAARCHLDNRPSLTHLLDLGWGDPLADGCIVNFASGTG